MKCTILDIKKLVREIAERDMKQLTLPGIPMDRRLPHTGEWYRTKSGGEYVKVIKVRDGVTTVTMWDARRKYDSVDDFYDETTGPISKNDPDFVAAAADVERDVYGIDPHGKRWGLGS